MTIPVHCGTMAFMNVKDARSLVPAAQEALRARAVKAVREGLSQVEAAATFEVARGTINRWCRSYEEQGRKALKGRKRGRPAGSRLGPLQAARTLRSDHQTGTSYGRRGETPVIGGTGQRFRCNTISAITNRGKLYFMVFTKGFRVPVFLVFLKRLLRQVRRRVSLIVDGHPVHRAV